MPAVTGSLVMEQGADFVIVLTMTDNGVPTNLTGYTAKCQVRDKPGGAMLIDFSVAPCTISTPGAAGTVTFTCPASVTAALAAPAEYQAAMPWGYYDVKLIGPAPGNTVERDVQGPVYYSPQVTQ